MKTTAVVMSILIATLALSPTCPARAETIITTLEPINDYPIEISFRANISSDQKITDVTFRFDLVNRGASGSVKPVEFVADTEISARVMVETNPETAWLPLGNEFVYRWEVELADGSLVESEPESYLFLPPNREWREIGNELMTVYYYGERANTANRFLEAAAQTYSEMGDLLQVSLEHLPVKAILFVTPQEIAESQPSKGATFEASGIVTCGYRPSSTDDIVVVSAACSGGSSTETLRHEFTHIITAAAGESPLVRVPSWLDEGLAVYSQASAGEFSGAYRSAVNREILLPFLSLAIPPANPQETLLFYGQSHAMVQYLVEEKGAAKIAELMGRTKGGTRFDVAFEETFGIDMTEFEAEFRAFIGLPPAGTDSPDSRSSGPTAVPNSGNDQPADPTASGSGSSGTVPGRSGDDIDGFALGAIAFAVVAALIAVFLFLLSQMMANKRTAMATPTPAPPFARQDGSGPADDAEEKDEELGPPSE